MAIRYLSGINVDSNTLFVDDANNRVGIGTASPQRALNIVSNNAQIRISDSTAPTTNYWEFSSIFFNTNQDLFISNQSGTAITINASLNVGIGTGTPGHRLDVNGDVNISNANVYRIGGNTILAGTTSVAVGSSGATGSVTLRTTSGDGLVLNGSNVGIGTTSPSQKLDVVGNAKISADILLGTAGVSNNIYFADATSTQNVRINSYTDNTLFFDNFNGQYNFRTTNSYVSRLYIANAGNVGIGTTSPEQKLHVDGAIRLTSNPSVTGDGSSAQFWNGAGVGPIIAGANFQVRTNGNTTALHINSSQNVGIGTTAPASKLHVYLSNSEGLYLDGLQEYTTFKMLYGGNQKAEVVYHYPTDQMYFNKFGTGTFAFYGGNVGIGTSSPASILHVSSTGANAYSSTITKGSNMKGIVNTLSNNDDDMVGIYFATGSAAGTHWSGITGSRSQNAVDWSTQLNFYTHDENVSNLNDATQKMVIKGSGNVGIGTTSPARLLHIKAGSGATGAIRVDSDNGNVANVLEVTTAGDWSFNTNSQEVMRLYNASGGRVGIGTTSPANKLHVVGAASADAANIRIDSTSEYGGLVINENTTFRTILGYGNTGNIFSNAQTDSTSLRGANYLHLGASSAATITINGGNDYVGIGTTSPSYKLDISTSQSIRVTGASTGYTQGSIIFQSSTTDSPGARGLGVYLFNEGTDATWFYGTGYNAADTFVINRKSGATYQDSAAAPGESSNFFAITNAGNVGIGTTSPTEILELSTTTDPKIRFVDVGNTDAKIGIVGSTALGFEVNGSERMRIASTGATRLNAYGSGSFTGTVAYNLAVDSSGNIIETAGGVVDGSGTANYVSKWSDANTLTNSVLYDDGTNVGIGTTSPASKLQIGSVGSTGYSVGNGLALGDGTRAGALNVESGGTNLYSSTNLIFSPGTTEAVRITSAGNVGIGTTGPKQRLDVAGAGGKIAITNTGTTNYSEIIFYEGATVKADIWVNGSSQADYAGANSMNIWQGSNAPIAFYTNGSNERLRITAAGNVGIGTNSPAQKLHVVGNGLITGNLDVGHGVSTADAAINIGTSRTDSGYAYLDLIGDTTYSDYGLRIIRGNAGANAASDITHRGTGDFGINTVEAAALKFRTTNVERMRITAGGSLLIGSTTQGYNPQTLGYLLGVKSDTTQAFISIAKSGQTLDTDGMIVGLDSTTGYVWMRQNVDLTFGTNNTTKVTIAAAGNVGIGTTSPAYKLQVDGSTGVRNGSFYIGDESGSTNSAVEFYKSGTTIRMYTNTGAFGGTYGATSASLTLYSGSAYSTLINGNGDSYFNAGNIGIGTTAPYSNLEITSTDISWGEGITINPAPAGYSATFYRVQGTSGSSYTGTWAIGKNSSSDAGGESFQIVKNGLTGSTAYRVDAVQQWKTNGDSIFGYNVGIGNTTPSQKLHVTGNIRVTGAYYDSNNSAGSSGQVLSSTGSGTDWVSLSEITGVDGTGTANYIAKWSDTDTITNSSITDDGTTVTATATNFVSQSNLGTAYTSFTTSGTTAIFDTITRTDAAIYQIIIVANPNSAGSGSYQDFYYGKIFIGTGYNGSAVVQFINYHQESPMPRGLYGSGGGDLTVTAVMLVSGSEVTEVANGTSYTIRIKIAGYQVAGAGTTVRLQRIM